MIKNPWRVARCVLMLGLIYWMLEQATWPWVVFYNLVGLGLAYAWKKGALQWR